MVDIKFTLCHLKERSKKRCEISIPYRWKLSLFTPEYAIDIQRIIGADIIMAFDECTPYPCDFKYAKKSMELTHRWLKDAVTDLIEQKVNIILNKLFFLLFKEVYTKI